MSCVHADRLEAQVADYLGGTLDPASTRELQGHLAACPACRAEVDGLVAVWAGLGLIPDEEPGEALRARFYARLEAALAEGEGRGRPAAAFAGFLARGWPGRPLRPLHRAVAAALLVAVGIGIGLVGGALGRGGAPAAGRGEEEPATSGEVAALRGEVEAMGRLLALSLLAQDSASERLKGVRWSARTGGAEEVTAALLATLSDDPNVNVRLAAVDALARYADRPAVAEGLAEALPRETSPLVQLALVDAVVAGDGRRAAPALQALLAAPGLDATVRERAADRLARLG
jgi:hypothetical protein